MQGCPVRETDRDDTQSGPKRRLLVISETSLAELHEILQNAFDWSGEHLHRFLIHGAAYGVPCIARKSTRKRRSKERRQHLQAPCLSLTH